MRKIFIFIVILIPLLLSSDIAYIDSVSREISVDSLFDILDKLSGEEAYPSGYVSWNRFAILEGADSAANYLKAKLEKFGLDSVFYQYYTDTIKGSYVTIYGDSIYTSQNIVAFKKGNVYSDTCIIIGAHYDCSSSPEGDITTKSPGVDDNGSGAAAIIEMSRIIAGIEADYDIYLVCFNGEEIGAHGSTKFLNEFIIPNNIYVKLMVNMDMIGYSGSILKTYMYTEMSEVLDLGIIICDSITDNAIIHNNNTLADDIPYNEAGYRSCGIIEFRWSDYPGYHSTDDYVSYIDSSFYWDNVRFAFGLMYYAANSPQNIENVSGKDNGDSTITIFWNSSPETDVDHYIINYKKVYDTFINHVGPIGRDSANFTISGMEIDTQYVLSVTAVDTGGYKSFPSSEIILTPTFIPSIPVNVWINSDSANIYLKISNSECADFEHFNIYRGLNESTLSIIGLCTDSIFTDTSVLDTSIYAYAVTAVDTTGLESEYSDIVYGRLIKCSNYMLVVDETKNGTLASDAHCDALYDSIFEGYSHKIIDADSIRIINSIIFGNYSKTIIINDDLIENKLDYQSVEDYLNNGGKLMFFGWNIGNNITGKTGDNPVFTNGTDRSNYLFNIDIYRYKTEFDMKFMNYNINGEDTVRFSEDKLPRGSGGNLNYGGIFNLNGGNVFGRYGSISGDSLYEQKPVMYCSDDTALIIINAPLFCMEYGDAQVLTEDLLSLWDVILGIPDRGDANNISFINVKGIQIRHLLIDFLSMMGEYTNICVYDINGRKLYEKDFYIDSNKADIILDKDFKTGVYFVKVNTGNNEEIFKTVLLK